MKCLGLFALGAIALLASIVIPWIYPQLLCRLNSQACPISYSIRRLEQFLQQQKWQAADQETYRLLVKAAQTVEQQSPSNGSRQGHDFKDRWLTPERMLKVPCNSMQEIDRLWVQYSQDRFGLSVQQRLWADLLNHPEPLYDPFKAMQIRLGWLKPNGSSVAYAQYPFSLDAPPGQYPSLTLVDNGQPGVMLTMRFNPILLFHRAKVCLTDPAPETHPVPLQSARAVDYSRLKILLKNQEWILAGTETELKLAAAGGRQSAFDFFSLQDFAQLPCQDLQTVDRLWSRYSRGRFGLSIQRQIWDRMSIPGAPSSSQGKFAAVIGRDKTYAYDTSLSQVNVGHFPRLSGGFSRDRFFARLQVCGL
ncbi:hypothetical protein BST81_08380 [Leptolyngbya sp. 'hensonii']|nr:hypothetical protein BST81_08380 [Leptolyngbya sp. 'hensonii']